MLACVFSCAVIGLEGVVIEVEVDTGGGLPMIIIVGLPDAAVQESKERVQSAIKNSGFSAIRQRIRVNLAPASVRKAGPAYDLPIAVGILIASGQLDPLLMSETMLVGELSLDGSLRHVKGVLPMAAAAAEAGFKRFLVPEMDASEAALVTDLEVIPVPNLRTMVDYLMGYIPLEPAVHVRSENDLPVPVLSDFSEIKGQEHVKRALEVAAAGNHNMMMKGPPGTGKTLLARSVPGIMPEMNLEESLDVTRIYSVADQLPPNVPLIRSRPFRAPHHTISHAGLVGGGNWPQPGEISLAHRGVLFLDELPEFDSRVLEVMRQPMEDKVVTISRASGSLTFPANFMLIGAMNPCPCGYFGDPERACTCANSTITRYQKRISGPLMDRIDIHVQVPRVDYAKLSDKRVGESSADIRARVAAARRRQEERFAKAKGKNTNADMGPKDIRKHCALDAAGEALMRSAMSQLQLSARGYHRVLKLSRTIADLAGVEAIEVGHLAEALQYRSKE